MMTDGHSQASGWAQARPALRVWTLAALVAAEALALVAIYQLRLDIACHLVDANALCLATRSVASRVMVIGAALGFYALVRRSALRALLRQAQDTQGPRAALALHLAGAAAMFAPLALFPAGSLNQNFTATAMLLLTGATAAGTGAALWLMPARGWAAWAWSEGWPLALVLILGLTVTDAVGLARILWDWAGFSTLTFFAVAATLAALGQSPQVTPESYIIGVEGFRVEVAWQCSGIEGLALTATFCILYSVLMRGDLRQGRFWAVLFPLALAASWIFNILRIAGLILIGAHVSPEHAVNGFHSYAGWLMFLVLVFAILALAHGIRWFHRTALAPAPPALRDPALAMLLPFLVMMTTGVVASAFWSDPAEGYVWRAAAMTAALALFTPMLTRDNLRPSALSLGAGLAIGIAWIATEPGPTDLAQTLSVAPPLLLAARLAGSVLLVPLIEELFFRGYLLARLDGPRWPRRLLAVAVSSLLFGLMHERLLAGALAGLVFAALYLQRRRMADPVAAHIAANLLIAATALAR